MACSVELYSNNEKGQDKLGLWQAVVLSVVEEKLESKGRARILTVRMVMRRQKGRHLHKQEDLQWINLTASD